MCLLNTFPYPSIITLAAIRPSVCAFDNFVVVPTTGACPNRCIEGGFPLVPIVIGWVVMVIKLPRRCAESVAAIHVWQHGLLSMIPGREASALYSILPEYELIPALTATVGIARPRPRTVAAARVEFVLVISFIADVPSASLPVHGVVRCIA